MTRGGPTVSPLAVNAFRNLQMRRLILVLALGGLCTVPDLAAQPANGRQYYSSWVKHSVKPYYYRYYYYKPTPSAATYSYHYGIYYPSRGKRIYMFNPHTKKYWGYWDGEQYSLLPKDKQKASIEDIAAEDFPKPGKPPRIPEIDEDLTMLAPPGEFPKSDDDKP